MGNKSGKGEPDLFDMAFEMQFEAKQLEKQAVRIERDMKKEEAKVIQLMNSGNHDAARISAERYVLLVVDFLHSFKLFIRVTITQ